MTQELDSKYIIDRFVKFDPAHYQQLTFVPGKLVRTCGQVGVLAYAEDPHLVEYGDPEQVQCRLKNRKSSDRLFFDLERTLFLRSSGSERAAAIKRAAQ